MVLTLEEILCSRYHIVTSEAQLDSITRLLSGLLKENNVQKNFLENRALLVKGEDSLHLYEGCSLEDLSQTIECELSVETGGDKRKTSVDTTPCSITCSGSLVNILDNRTNWLKIYKQSEERFVEIRFKIWNLVSEPFLEKDDTSSPGR